MSSLPDPPIVRKDMGEHVRMADEAARDVWRTVMLYLERNGGKSLFGVQHADGRIILMVEVKSVE